MFRATLVILGAAVLLFAASCSDGRSYPVNRGDNEYRLEAMMLQDTDVPAGIARTDEKGFTNEEWAQVFDTDDPDTAQQTLDGQQRIRNYIAFFSWDNPQEHFGTVLSITSQSTLYKDEASARKSLRENRFSACGLIVAESDTNRAETFTVPKLGDEAVGMFITQQQQTLGTSVDTIVCFRTGRIVHAVVQTGLDGTQDVALAVKLAERMRTHVNAAFDGKADGTATAVPDQTPAGG